MTSDLDLLRQFVRENSQDAFSEIVRRHLNLVYSAALRQVRSPQLAEEIAQSVFADLARNAGKLKSDTIVIAWLYSVTRRTAIDVIRKESRRQLREQIAMEMQTMNATANDWTQIEPLLDDAMAALDETDRAAILLRYFENKNLRDVGVSLKISDDAAQKRVSRAVERLREFFSKQKISVGASGLVILISANAVQSAPATLAKIITAAAIAKGAAGSSTYALAKGALKFMAWKKTAMIAGAILLFTAGTIAISSAWLKKSRDAGISQIMVTASFVEASAADKDAIAADFAKSPTARVPGSKAFQNLIAKYPGAKISSAPRAVTGNGMPVEVSVTRAVKIGGVYTNVGATLDITPNLEPRAVALNIHAKFSELTEDVPPTIRKTELEQSVKLLPGNMVTLGKEIGVDASAQTNWLLIYLSPQIVDPTKFRPRLQSVIKKNSQ